MKLTKVRITNFQSVQDSNEFDIGDVTCLVGKNEAGKTALLKALYRLNPVVPEHATFDPTDDYPRSDVSNYEDAVRDGHQKPALVVTASYELEPDDLSVVEKVFGPHCLVGEPPTITLSKTYANRLTFNLQTNRRETMNHLVESADIPHTLIEQIRSSATDEDALKALAEAEQTEAVESLARLYQKISERSVSKVVYDSVLSHRIPKYLYFDEYYQMTGRANVNDLQRRLNQDALIDSDRPLLGLIELAGINLDQLADPERTSALRSRLEGAENRLTGTVLRYWSQNRHLRMAFDIRPGLPRDPEGMTSGINIWGLVRDTKHMVSTELGTRSRGFVWFFSFLAWYSQLPRER